MSSIISTLSEEDRERLIRELSDLLGADHVITDAGEIKAASLDSRRRRQGEALALLRPGTPEEVAAILRFAANNHLVVIPQGGNTSTVGGATPNPESPLNARTLILQLSRMNRILAIDAVNSTMTVEAGAVLERVQAAAKEAGKLFPVSFAAQSTAQIGGMLAANAGGVHVVRYGMARRNCLGIEVVLADGRILNLMRSVRKDNASYDLRDLFIGSEGTLGVITKAVLDLSALPAGRITVFASLGELRAVEKLFTTLEDFAGPSLTAFELISKPALEPVIAAGRKAPIEPSDWMVLFDLSYTKREDPEAFAESLTDALSPLFEDGTLTDAAIAQTETQAEALWTLREEIPTAVRASGGNIKNDISVPRGSLCAFIEETYARFEKEAPWLLPMIFGHYGDGNLHFNLGNKPELGPGYWKAHEREIHRLVNDEVVRFGGSVAAEHGVGAKIQVLERTKDPLELELMKKLRGVFDPEGILNPGRVVRYPENVWQNPKEAWD